MLRVTIYGSGSSGNAVCIDDMINIDAGLPCETLAPLTLITHAHSDHTKYLETYRHTCVAAPKAVIESVMAKVPKFEYMQRVVIDDCLVWRDAHKEIRYEIRPITLVHDITCVGYDITAISRSRSRRMLYATDFREFAEPVMLAGYDCLYLECNNTLRPSDISETYLGDDRPKDSFHRQRSWSNHCNVHYLIDLFRRAGFSERKPCDVPLTLLHKSSYYYDAHPDDLRVLRKIANVMNP